VIPEDLREEYPFKHHFLDIKNSKLHYVDEGRGEPILMVHGNPTWSFYYRHLIREFSKTHRVIAPDHLGMGLSDKPQNYDYKLENHVINLITLVNTLELQNITLVVHDWGGAIGLGYATLCSENIKRIVILNSAAFVDTKIPFRINLCRMPGIGEWLVQKHNMFASFATSMAVTKKLSAISKKAYLYPYKTHDDRIGIMRFVQDIPLEVTHKTYRVMKTIENGLNRIKAPKLILWGGKDFCFDEHFLARWREIYPDAKVHVYPDAGHYVLEDAHGDIEGRIRDFIS